ncbi:MAG: site-specific DNA-methyltransferase [Promethearchaeota archaeon]
MANKDYDEKNVKKLLREVKKLKEENKNLKSRKKYGIVWEEEKEPEKVVLECKEKVPILKDVKDKEILTDDKKPMNLLIKGDNYHALQVLNYTHKGKVDVIYIDPPYNTGKKKEWKYNDHFVDKEDTYRHSKWLNFMNKRLRLAKELLKDDGAIFISIDENELAQLKLLCDEIFGEDNFVGKWDWYKSATPPNLSHKIKRNIEYILGYEKSRNNFRYKGVKKTSSSDDPITKPQNSMKKLIFPPKSINFKQKNGKIKAGIYGTKKYPNKLLNDLEIVNYKNLNEVIFENRFIWIQEKLDYELENETKINASKSLVISYKKASYSEEVPPNLIDGSVNVETTEEAGKALFEIFGEKIFDYPKPVSLIQYIINFKLGKKGIILDFFAGTGTTAHAVLELNNLDKGNRKVILCTNNEDNNGDGKKICSDICLPRVKKIIKGYTTPKNTKVKGLGGNLKYFKTDFIDVGNVYNISDEHKIEITHKAGEMIAIREDVFDEVEKNEWWQIFKSKNKVVAIYFREDQKKLKKLFEKLKKDKAIIYLFSWGKNELKTSEYGYDNIKIKDIPQPIIDVYKEINRL